MRWWLAATFAGIAALTALAVAQVFGARSESAIRERAQELVAGAAVAAAAGIPPDATAEEIDDSVARFARNRGMALFAFSNDGSLVTPPRSRGVSVLDLPNIQVLLEQSLAGRREVDTIDGGRVVTVALPMQRTNAAALVAVASRSDLEDALGIVRQQIVTAAIWATGIGALVGVVVALLITRRLRRIANATADIEHGRFDRKLEPRFHDELGTLAQSIDRMRERLRDSFDRLESDRDRLSRLLEQLQEGVIAVDRELTVEFANSRAYDFLGSDLSPGEPLPDPWEELSVRDLARQLFEPGSSGDTIRASLKAGSTYVVALLPPASGSDTGVVVLTDVTEQERRERAEREFVTNAAHELRTPLAAIASAVEVLQGGAKESAAERDRFLAVVERQTGRLTRLANALLTLARAQTRSEPVRLEPVRLEPLVAELAEGSGGPIEVELRGDDLAASAHLDLLLQTLENLTVNALKHAPGARVTIRVAPVGADFVKIEVIDTGPGMTHSERQRALDRFYQAGSASELDGFGLGLPIAREAVSAMGGTLRIESTPGGGTTVSIVLPHAARTGAHA